LFPAFPSVSPRPSPAFAPPAGRRAPPAPAPLPRVGVAFRSSLDPAARFCSEPSSLSRRHRTVSSSNSPRVFFATHATFFSRRFHVSVAHSQRPGSVLVAASATRRSGQATCTAHAQRLASRRPARHWLTRGAGHQCDATSLGRAPRLPKPARGSSPERHISARLAWSRCADQGRWGALAHQGGASCDEGGPDAQSRRPSGDAGGDAACPHTPAARVAPPPCGFRPARVASSQGIAAQTLAVVLARLVVG